MAAALLATSAATAAADPGSNRQTELLYLLTQDCGSCHGMTLKGGLGPSLRPEALEGKPAAALADTIRSGVPGTPMPPWAFEITEDEAEWLARTLKTGNADAR
ncbi:MAG: cytochrome c [Alphaproteobacteria bacterium]